MQVNITTTEGLGRRISLQLPVEEVEQQVNKKLQELTKTAKIDGFRPGKVPTSVLKQRLGGSVRQEVIGDLMQKYLVEAIKQEKLDVASQPMLEIQSADENKPVDFSATFEIYPEIQLKGLEDVEIEQIISEILEEDINRVLTNLRKQHADWDEVDRSAKLDDRVLIDFEGTIDGVAFEGGKAEEAPVVLGSKTMIPGFEEGILGKKAGDEFEIEVTFPESYHSKELAGKKAVFKIKLHQVFEPKLPELDDSFAEKFGIKEGGLAKLNEDLLKTMTREFDNALHHKNKMALFEKWLELNPMQLPNTLVDAEIENLRKQMLNQWGNQVDTNQLPELPRNLFEEQARQRVALGLLLREYLKINELKPDSEVVHKLITEVASVYKDPEEVIKWYYADKQRLAHYEMLALEEQVLDKLRKSAKIKEKNLSYEEVMK